MREMTEDALAASEEVIEVCFDAVAPLRASAPQ